MLIIYLELCYFSITTFFFFYYVYIIETFYKATEEGKFKDFGYLLNLDDPTRIENFKELDLYDRDVDRQVKHLQWIYENDYSLEDLLKFETNYRICWYNLYIYLTYILAYMVFFRTYEDSIFETNVYFFHMLKFNFSSYCCFFL